MDLDPLDVDALRQEKYGNDPAADMESDLARLKDGEPLAYIIGNQPFLGLSIDLSSKPLIPRPETEWWAELLVTSIGDKPLRVLDLCAGSGAIGLAVLKYCPNAHVSFGELMPEHVELIATNIKNNQLDPSRADIRVSDLFQNFSSEQFDVIATNPPYIPDVRALTESVVEYEPKEALFAGSDGLSVIRTIATKAPVHLLPGGALWMECDVDNIEEAQSLLEAAGGRVELHTDLYGRPRLLVGYW